MERDPRREEYCDEQHAADQRVQADQGLGPVLGGRGLGAELCHSAHAVAAPVSTAPRTFFGSRPRRGINSPNDAVSYAPIRATSTIWSTSPAKKPRLGSLLRIAA